MKHKLNVILSIMLILGIILSGYGSVCMALMPQAQMQTAQEDPASPSSGEKGNNPNGMTQTGNAKNEMTLNDNVQVFTGDKAEDINNAIVNIESTGDPYSMGGALKITLDGEKEDLFGELSSGDIFLLDGDRNTPFAESYIMKIDSIYDNDGETMLYVSQPRLSEAFESVDIGFSNALTEKNLVSSHTEPGVTAYFKSPQSAPPANHNYTVQTLSTAPSKNYEATTVANDYSATVGDFVINLEYNLLKKEEEEDSGRFEADIDAGFTLKGEVGLKDLTAHMVFDMPSPFEINELYFGLSGEIAATGVGLNGLIEGSFSGAPTKKEFDSRFLDYEISGLNEKAIPLGIWHFSASTLVPVTVSSYETLRMSPSIFLLMYSDLEGNIFFDYDIGFDYSNKFNSGLSVVRDGDLVLKAEGYPYEPPSGDIAKPEKSAQWSVDITLEASLDLTLFGTSVSFCIGGINVGEVAMMELGFDAECNFTVNGTHEEGVTPSEDNGAYLRMYLKLLEYRVKLSASFELFEREGKFGTDDTICLADLTLFSIGDAPGNLKKTPVSTMDIPEDFDSAITIVGDVSGSMTSTVDTGETKIEAARKAAKVIADMVEKWSGQYSGVFGLGVIQFSDTAKVITPPHIDYDFISDAIDSMDDGGGTDIEHGLKTAIEQLDATEATTKTIILMTDGEDSNHSGIKSQATLAKDKGIKIFTIGFGSGANEELLTEVADISGGEYRFADTTNMVGIIASFMYAYQSSEADVLGDYEGAVSEGETADAGSFKVPEKSGDLNTTLYWPGSFLDLILVDPNNKVVDEKYPGATIDETTIPSTITVEDPVAGKWQIRVKGVETSYENEPFYAITSFKELKRDSTPKLKTYALIGAYSLPVGLLMIITSAMFLILVNYKKDK